MNGAEGIQRLPTDELHLDRSNPRLAEHGISKTTKEKEVIRLLWDVMDIQELVQSIVASGYFEQEPLIVAREDGRYVVIEGNRRVAAVKVLLDPKLSSELGCQRRVRRSADLEKLKHLPAIVAGREDSWRYLGFKHVNGPAKWSSYAKAQYISDIHGKYNIPLEDIAEQIGDRHKTVQRLYRGLKVIEQAERAKVFDREDRFRTRFAFSHLYTGLDYDGISKFLSLKSSDIESSEPVPKGAFDRLGELCLWLYGSKKQQIPPVIGSQNPDLRNLDSVLKNRESLSALRNGVLLSRAIDYGRAPQAVLEEKLLDAKRALQEASGYVTPGYRASEDLLRIANDVAELARDIVEHMERMKKRSETRESPRRPRRGQSG